MFKATLIKFVGLSHLRIVFIYVIIESIKLFFDNSQP